MKGHVSCPSAVGLKADLCFAGVFSVAGIIDAFIYHGQRKMKKKVEIGKFG